MRRTPGPRRGLKLALASLPLLIAACSATVGPSATSTSLSPDASFRVAPDGSIALGSPPAAGESAVWSRAPAATSTPPAATSAPPAAPSAAPTTAASIAAATVAAPGTGTPAPAGQAAGTASPTVPVGPVPSIHPGFSPVAPGGQSPSIAPLRTGAVACTAFPSTNVWNKPVDTLPVASNSKTMINAIGASSYVHPDFDAVGDGIPFNVVTAATPTYTVHFQYASESDPGPYPIPANPLIESGSDRHLLSIDFTRCKLWELYDASKSGSTWYAGSGAVFDLRSNALRPDGWTSADAAGLPIYAGLVRYDEILSGSINHALRFTAPSTCGYIYPATHLTAPPCSNKPPMGLRVRLKASVDISGFGPHVQVLLRALKKYGMLLADNGSPWFISGTPDARWDDDEFHALHNLHGSDFEVVDTSSFRNG
jgi:hypothetical protein